MTAKFRFLIIGIVAFIGGIYLAITGYSGHETYIQEPVDIYDEKLPQKISSMTGRHVSGDLYYAVDVCARMTEKSKYSSKEKITQYYYIVPIWDENDEMYFITAQVKPEQQYKMDDLIEAFWAEEDSANPVSVQLDGIISKANKDVMKYMKEWFVKEGSYTTAEIDKVCLPYTLQLNAKDPVVSMYVGIAIGVIGLGLLAACFLSGNGKSKKKALKKALKKESIMINMIDYPIHTFDAVNDLVERGQKADAVRLLSEIANIPFEEATSLIEHWDKIYF